MLSNVLDVYFQHFVEFERHVYDHAGSACKGLFDHGHGLLSLVVSDLVWRNRVPIVRLRDTLLQPVQPADTATAGAWKAYEARIRRLDSLEKRVSKADNSNSINDSKVCGQIPPYKIRDDE